MRKAPVDPDPKPCAHKRDDLGYVQAHIDAERRLKRGERQSQCPRCGAWLWRHER